MRPRAVGEAWAVRIEVCGGQHRAWLNGGGGYVRARYDRKLFADRSDAREEARQWCDHAPKLVRVTFRGHDWEQASHTGEKK